MQVSVSGEIRINSIMGDLEDDFDEDYEFDAENFFDFMRDETDSEIDEAERWFQFSGEYPDSFFLAKLDFEKLISMEALPQTSTSMNSTHVSDANSRNQGSASKKNANSKGFVHKTNSKSDDELYRSTSPTFLKPTLSYLLKQHNVSDKHSNHLCRSLCRITSKFDQKGVCKSIRTSDLEMIRQTPDIGYLSKVAQLKHRFLLLHKSSKKVTTPKEPELQTSVRAQNRRADSGFAATVTNKQNKKGFNFSMNSLNKKLVHLKKVEKPNSHASAKVHPNARDVDSNEAANHKPTLPNECILTPNNDLCEGSPAAQFSQLCLVPENKIRNISNSKSNRFVRGMIQTQIIVEEISKATEHDQKLTISPRQHGGCATELMNFSDSATSCNRCHML